MKGLSCNSSLLSHEPIEQAIDMLAEHGYAAVDVSAELQPPVYPLQPPHMGPDDDAATRKRVRRHAEQAGIVIAAVNGHTNLCSAIDEQRAENFAFLDGVIELAADLGAPYVVIGPGGKDMYQYVSQYWQWSVDAFANLAAKAQLLGVTLACEAGSPLTCLVYNLALLEKFLAEPGLEQVRVLFDPAHFYIRGDDVVPAYRRLADRVVHVHAKDARGHAEDIEFPPLGLGRIDYPALINAMLEHGYDGYLSVEYEALSWGYSSDVDKVLSEGKAFLEGLIAATEKRG